MVSPLIPVQNLLQLTGCSKGNGARTVTASTNVQSWHIEHKVSIRYPWSVDTLCCGTVCNTSSKTLCTSLKSKYCKHTYPVLQTIIHNKHTNSCMFDCLLNEWCVVQTDSQMLLRNSCSNASGGGQAVGYARSLRSRCDVAISTITAFPVQHRDNKHTCRSFKMSKYRY